MTDFNQVEFLEEQLEELGKQLEGYQRHVEAINVERSTHAAELKRLKAEYELVVCKLQKQHEFERSELETARKELSRAKDVIAQFATVAFDCSRLLTHICSNPGNTDNIYGALTELNADLITSYRRITGLEMGIPLGEVNDE